MWTYTPVTNTYKIIKHFKACKHEPLIIIQGSQGASKTVSILMLIIDHFRNNQNLEITICSSERTKLMDTAFNDLKKIMIDWNLWNNGFKWNGQSSKLHSTKGNGFIEFIGLDKDDIGKGRRRDIIYINECNKVSQNKYFDITQRSKKTIVDFNADKRFYIHDLINDTNFIQLDFTGNEKLSEEERRNIISYKDKGYNEDGTIKNEYYANKWRVYGLGEIGGVEGRIYHWKRKTLKEYQEFEAKEYIGCDWGKVDPFAVIGVKYKDGVLMVHEYNYDSENILQQKILSNEIKNSENGIVTYVFNKSNIDKKLTIICDNSQLSKVKALMDAGYSYAMPIKAKRTIIERIALVQQLEVYYTDVSINIENEQYESCWAKDRAGNTIEEREDMNNHSIDAIEYVILYLHALGIIK